MKGELFLFPFLYFRAMISPRLVESLVIVYFYAII